MYPKESPYVVWCRDCWWSDTWDATKFCVGYEGPENFFEKMKKIQLQVPREGLVSLNAENSEYSNHIRDSKDCYMCALIADQSEHSFYSYSSTGIRNCSDVLWGRNTELLYFCVLTLNSYNCSFLSLADNCTDCHYSYDIKNCSNVMFSSNLRNKSYVFRNEQLSKEAYEKEVAKLQLSSFRAREEYIKEFQKILDTSIHRYANLVNCQNCSGQNVYNSVNTQIAYGSFDDENVYNAGNVLNAKNIVYGFAVGTQPVEWGYNVSVIKGGSNVVGCYNTVLSSDIYFSENLVSCNDCIGCIGLNKKSFCILNKQYSKEEYEKIKSELLEYWRTNDQLASPMPQDLACFAYNESPAQDYYPSDRETAIKFDFKWQDNMPGTHGKETLQPQDIADDIHDVNESICKEILTCIQCQRNYKIIKPEFDLYKKLALPVPRQCFDCRHRARLKILGIRRLFHRTCTCNLSEHSHPGTCQNSFVTIHKEGEMPEKVFCESCYQKEVA